MAFQRGIRPLTMAEQELAMLLHRPVFTHTRRNPWVWRGIVRAGPNGQSFVIDIEAGYRSGGGVRILCREPVLVPTRETGRPPHTFDDGSLCVNDRSPTAYQFLAETTVPWIYSWIFFYERWLDTGTWDGPQSPGHELGAPKPAGAAGPNHVAGDARPRTRASKRTPGEPA